jgi:hypothetical protein
VRDAPGPGTNGASRTASAPPYRVGERFVRRLDGGAPECPYHPGWALLPVEQDGELVAVCFHGCLFGVSVVAGP